jgi:PAS domain S-box-containing protein
MKKLRFLLLEDSLLDFELIQTTLQAGNMDCELVRVQTRADYLAALETSTFDLILSDYSLPNFDGISALEIACSRYPETPFIFVSATLGEELAIEALKQGATDYVLKQRLERLVPSVQRALREAQERCKRKQAEGDRDRFFTALELTNMTLQILVESCPLAVIFFDTKGNVKLWNQAAEQLFGWKAEEVLEQFLRTVPHRRNEFLTNLQAVLAGRALRAFETQHQRKDGQMVDLEIWMTSICDAQGNPGCLCLASNITQRKLDEIKRQQAEADLRQSEARFKRLVQSNLIGCIFWQTNGAILEANDAFLEMVGYTREDLAAGRLNWREMTPSPQIHLSDRAIAQMRETGSTAPLEKEYLRKDGSRVPVLLGGVMFENSTDQGVSFVVNLSELKQAESALKEHNERLKLLFQTTSDLLLTEQPLLLMNSLFKKLSVQMDLHCYFNYLIDQHKEHTRLRLQSFEGLTEADVEPIKQIEIGQYMCGLVAQERCQIVIDNLQQSNHPNAQGLCALGATAYAGQPLIARGKLLGTLSFASKTRTTFTANEIALLQAASDQVAIALERAELVSSLQKQTEQLTQANHIKDEFLAVLSHELRTPLNSILGWSKLLRTRKLSEEKVTYALEIIERNAKLQTQLIEDLLDVSRILQGKMSLRISSVDPVYIIRAAIETVHLAAEAKSIQINTLFEPNVGKILGDPNRLQQVVWNLLSNAVKFTPNGGQVEVKLEQVSSHIQIRVSDTGKGIEAEFLPHIFEYFQQEDGSITRRFGGLGLGLAIVRQIVELHGGVVQAASPGEGKGSTFVVQLPQLNDGKTKIDPQISQLSSTVVGSSLPLLNIRILVVDDEANSRELAAFVLEQAGAIVTSVASAKDALKAFSKLAIDILVSDIGMPEIDGYTLIEQIQAYFNQQHSSTQSRKILKAIALTAYAGETNRQKALEAGFQAHLAKPIEPDKLISAVVNLIQQNY